MALAVGHFLFWGFLGQLCHATCLLQGCYLALMRKCVLFYKVSPLSLSNRCRLEGKMEREASCPITIFSCALKDSSTETLKRKLFSDCDNAESNSTQAPSLVNAYFLQCISHRVSSFIQKLCEVPPHLQHWNWRSALAAREQAWHHF